MVLTGNRLLVAMNLVCGLSILFFGYDQGMMSGVNNTPDYVKTMKLGNVIPPSDTEKKYTVDVTNSTKLGGIVAIYYLGAIVGALIGGWVADKLGRINCIRIGCVWVLLGAALQCSAQNTNWMLCARVINGIGTGHLNVTVPVWSAECATYNSRGLFIGIEFTLNIFGVVIAYWLEYGLSFIKKGDTAFRWRFPIGFQLIPLLLLAVLVNFMPESPRWLVKKGRDEEAKVILGNLRGEGDPNHPKAVAEYKDIKELADEESGLDTSYISMFFKNQGKTHLRRRVQLVIWLQIVQEWVGIAAITVYQPTIFKQAGFNTDKSDWLSGVNNIIYMFSTILAAFTLDRWGRRGLSYWGAIAQGIAMFLAGGFSRLAQNNPDTPIGTRYGAASATFVILYTAVFGATWLTVPWIYPSEIWPVQVRAKGMAWGVVGWGIGNGWLTLLNPVMFSAIAEKTLYIFGACNFASIVMIWAFYPETAKRTLEEIDALFSAPTPWNWDAEKVFAQYQAEKTNYTRAVEHGILNPDEPMIDEKATTVLADNSGNKSISGSSN